MIYLGNQAVGLNKNERVNIAEAELSSIAIRTNPANMFYVVGETFNPTGMEVVANYIVGEDNLNNVLITNYTYTTSALVAGDNTITISYTFSGVTKTASLVVKAFAVGNTLNDTSWATISQVARAGVSDHFWDIGDCKAITLNGKMGTLNLNTTLYVFILDFNHSIDKTTPDNNIIFGGFKTALTGGVDIALCDSSYGNANTSGFKWFNINHYDCLESTSGCNYGGWKGCDMRYDILGATSTPPSEYGGQKTTSNVGYDATATTISNPVENTLMSCLPSDFRNVLRLWTKYVDNTGNESNVNANVTAVVDAISLLSDYEIFGDSSYSTNKYERNHQKQMAYYIAGNSKVKYRHSSNTQAVYWWESSPTRNSVNSFCRVYINGDTNSNASRFSYGVAPAFKI